ARLYPPAAFASLGAVMIATNMAGRGTDIVLGDGVAEMGGLHILGTERHESRRIDNQLRGRAGRQGDPGSSRFYLSLEDDLLRIFGGERISGFMNKMGMGEGEPIEHKMISRAIENAQTKVEGHNFDIRKQLLDFDDVMNQQREVIYQQRQQALSDESLKPVLTEMIREKADEIAWEYVDEKTPADQWDLKGLAEAVYSQFNFKPDLDVQKLEGAKPEDVSDMICDAAMDIYRQKEQMVPEEDFRRIERIIMLQTVDSLWKDHLLSMDHLKEGIGLRGYAQQNPLMAYKKEAFAMFQEMIERIKEETLKILFRVQIAPSAGADEIAQPKEQEMTFSHGDGSAQARKPKRRATEKIGRNEPCPCGSGKKYKKCCGREK
ncbi:MAG: SEC-C metal-binding domain-containing protein, partial [Desulfobacterales bacterium]